MVMIQSSPTVQFSGRPAIPARIKEALPSQKAPQYQDIHPEKLVRLEQNLRMGDTAAVKSWMEKDGTKLSVLDPEQWPALEGIWSTIQSPVVDSETTGSVVGNMPRTFRRQKLMEILEQDDYQPSVNLKMPEFTDWLKEGQAKTDKQLARDSAKAATLDKRVQSLDRVLKDLEQSGKMDLAGLQRSVISDMGEELEALNLRLSDMQTFHEQQTRRLQGLDKEIALKEALEKDNTDLIFPSRLLDRPNRWVKRLTGHLTLREASQAVKSAVSRKPAEDKPAATENKPAEPEAPRQQTEAPAPDSEIARQNPDLARALGQQDVL